MFTIPTMGAMFGEVTPEMSAQQMARQQMQSYFNNNIVGGDAVSSVIGNIGNNIANNADNPNQVSPEIMPLENTVVGEMPAATAGNFSPQTQQVAKGNYGTQKQRGLFQEPKPLINL